jgi:hypothetical protein
MDDTFAQVKAALTHYARYGHIARAALPTLDTLGEELAEREKARKHWLGRAKTFKDRAEAAEAALAAKEAEMGRLREERDKIIADAEVLTGDAPDRPRLADASAAMDHFRTTLPDLMRSAVDGAVERALNIAAATYPHTAPDRADALREAAVEAAQTLLEIADRHEIGDRLDGIEPSGLRRLAAALSSGGGEVERGS